MSTHPTFTTLADLANHLDAAGDPRKGAIARTMREYAEVAPSVAIGALQGGFDLAGRIEGEGPVAARAATCRELAALLPRDTEIGYDISIDAWGVLIKGFEARRDSAPADAKGRYVAIVSTLTREMEAMRHML